MDCKEIIIKYLKANGYDVLINFDSLCKCDIDDIASCNCENILKCEPAYKIQANCKECEDRCDAYDEDNNAICFTIDKNDKLKSTE